MTQRTDTALLVIDAQDSFRQLPEDWEATANPAALSNIARLVTRSRAAGDIIVWVTHAAPGTGSVFDPALGFVRVMPEFDSRDDDIHVTKTSINAFTTTSLHRQLTQLGVRRIVICGIRTDQCCETTARLASDLGFEVEFVTDATTTSGIASGSTHGAVTGEDLMRRTESVLAARGFATIVTTAERTSPSA